MKWISCDGGPHILMERRCAEQWEACDAPSNGRIVKANFRWDPDNSIATDYDLACNVNDYIGLIDLPSGTAVVIDDDVPMSAWVTDKSGVGHIVVLCSWETDDYSSGVQKAIDAIQDDAFTETTMTLVTSERELFLFAACDLPMEPVYDVERIELEPGGYKILRLDSHRTADGEIRVFRFRRV